MDAFNGYVAESDCDFCYQGISSFTTYYSLQSQISDTKKCLERYVRSLTASLATQDLYRATGHKKSFFITLGCMHATD
jgi:hypothetical protein